jgi:hypothetical protein
MEVEAATATAANGVCHFPLHHLPSDLIDHAFTIANPHNFYLLAVLRLVCKELWRKIPLTILIYMADIGASFCGDLPVLKWIYNTSGIAHVNACASIAIARNDNDILSYIRDHLAYKTDAKDLYDPRPKHGPPSNLPVSAYWFTRRERWPKSFEACPETVIGKFSASLQNGDLESIKWFAEHKERSWGINFDGNPRTLHAVLYYTTYEMPTESFQLMCKEFGVDIWPLILDVPSRFPKDASVFDIAKMNRPHGSDTAANMMLEMIERDAVCVIPAVFLAAYHDSDPVWSRPSLDMWSFFTRSTMNEEEHPLINDAWYPAYGLVYTWTNIPLKPMNDQPLFRNLPVVRGPTASLMRKSALLRTNQFLLRILLRETISAFERKMIK